MTRYPDDRPTIRESTIPDTRRGPFEPPVENEYFEPVIQGPFFHEYRLIRQFPAAGGEADIWLVLKDQEYYILKHYRLGIEPKLEVLERVSEISKKHPKNLIRIFHYEFDEETKRWYEIQEYARDGSLRTYIQGQDIGIVQLKTIIAEIARGLADLHRNNILHLDLKPSNILVRTLRPLNLVLIDFGISTLLSLELSRQITSTKGTPMYWAPEQLGNVVGKEADYWALGVIILEIIKKHHPFEGMNHHLILSTLSTQGIHVPDDIQPNLVLLLKGLLTRNPKRRWGQKELTAWLSGRQNIPIFYEQEKPEIERKVAYEFREEKFYTLNDLSYAFIRDPHSWDDAKRHIGRGYLTRWLENTEQWASAVEVEKFIETYPNEDERLLFISARFNQDIPFTFFGKSLDVSHIVEYLGRYQNRKNDEQEKRIISMIFSNDLLRIYQIFIGITGQSENQALISRMFSWLKANTRGIDEKKRLYDFLRILKERERIGPPEEWDAKTILKLGDICSLFLKQGYDEESALCENDLKRAVQINLQSINTEPDLLVALAAVSEEFGHTSDVSKCLKKAARSDARVISLLFSKNTGFLRFKKYKRLVSDYEANLYTLSSDPWKETEIFWEKLFFILLGGGDNARSLSIAERLIELNRQNGVGWAMRGISLYRLGRVNEAEYFLSHNIVQKSVNPQVWQIVGEYYIGLEKTGEAENSFQKGLGYDQTHLGCLFGLVKIYSAQKKYHEVIALCENALAMHPDDQGILLKMGDAQFALGMISDAVRTYERYLTLAPSNAGVLKCLARCQIKLRRNKEADRLLNILLQQGETDPQIFRLKAYLLLISGNVEEALSYLDRTLEKEPDDIWTLRIKADAHISLKQYSAALFCLDRILAKEPENVRIAEKKGKILLTLGFSEDAGNELSLVLKRAKGSAELYILYGDSLRTRIKNRYGVRSVHHRDESNALNYRVNHSILDIWQDPVLDENDDKLLAEALAWYEKAAAHGGEGPALLNRRGIVAALQKKYDLAKEYFEKAEEQNPDPVYHTNLTLTFILNGEFNQASTLFLQAMSKYSNNPYFLDQCSGFYFLFKKDYKYALDLSSQALSANIHRDPLILYHSYLIQRSLNRNRDVKTLHDLILSSDPYFIITE